MYQNRNWRRAYCSGCVSLIGILLFQITAWAAEPLIVAHRGASGEAPENTLPAFELAWKQGADAIEADFRLTKDGHIVSVHDADTKKVSGKKLVVKDATLSELRQLDVGSFKGEAYKGTRIPTIQEVFATVPEGKKIFIEIKSGKEIVPQLLKDILKSGLKNEQIVIICFDAKVLLEVHERAAEIDLEFYTSWLVNFKKRKNEDYAKKVKQAFEVLKRAKVNGISTSKNLVNGELIKRANELGYDHHVWTVNDAPTAIKYKDWGTKTITTDFPERTRESLVEVLKN